VTSEITTRLILGAFFAVVFLPVADWVTTAALIDQSAELSQNLDKAVADIKSGLAPLAVMIGTPSRSLSKSRSER
jgi:hypothetical protein